MDQIPQESTSRTRKVRIAKAKATRKLQERTLSRIATKEGSLVDNNDISSAFQHGVRGGEPREATTDNNDPGHLRDAGSGKINGGISRKMNAK